MKIENMIIEEDQPNEKKDRQSLSMPKKIIKPMSIPTSSMSPMKKG